MPLIEPYGIEIFLGNNTIGYNVNPLIEPYGIEIWVR